ncbi:adenylyl-sulfate kinase [Methylopila jiangsuensis]|uniref:Multifunctional fusion protein n=1 Tax=Methylopila jiangsuensis TaxID=586230 RepID=A0A9W6N4Q0_9HYPH|nr:sulfate adenylyltransferase subunit CysN [Methylopila jiangsuensis]MDR6285051.1 bifunctional enzyme CysN/CysC [Methylopila jiangsuensis]GLK77560.1 adenylyl-sulfate kinase [Methylopila jiangsuensis]
MHAPLTTAELAGAAAEKTLLRFLTCGSVDDGKSTLIGRLLYDTKLVFDDQLAALEKDSRKHGTTGEAIDLALLVDGLEAEREQGITIDVAYRYFATAKRTFIVADTPGHEQYTRNMATGASNADLAVILIDARKGVLTQTKRHSFICSLLGIRHVALAVNKIDLVDYSESRFREIEAEYRAFAAPLGFETITPIPLSARDGDNVTAPSPRLAWHKGPTLLAHLEEIDVETDLEAKPFRFPVQWVNRPNLDFRGFAGTIASGTVRPGDEVVVAASGKTSRVARIVTMDGDLASASAGDSVTLTLEDEVDIARGDLLARPAERPEVSNQFAARLIWMQDERLLPGRSYLIKLATRTVPATVTSLKHKIDVNTLEKLAARTLGLNEIAEVNVETGAPIAFDPYADNRETGAFIVIDRETNATAGAGMVQHGLRRATNIHRHASAVDRAARARLKNQKPAIVWFTGLSASGKSTIANLVEAKLAARGQHTMLLDGDNVRFGLNKDLGFTDADRVENVRRIGEVAKLFTDAGVIALCSFISPFESERRMVRDLVGAGEFIEAFVDTPLETCIARDPKGLYKRALAGEIPNFTGVSSPYEAPQAAELVLPTTDASVDELADRVIAELERRGLIDAV